MTSGGEEIIVHDAVPEDELRDDVRAFLRQGWELLDAVPETIEVYPEGMEAGGRLMYRVRTYRLILRSSAPAGTRAASSEKRRRWWRWL